MEREGRKDAEERKCRAEDHAASRGMQMFLGCSKRLKDGRKISRSEAKTLEQSISVGMTTGQTQEIVPPKNDLSSFTYWGKRMLEGGLDSPSKRARVYNNLKDFWGGGGVSAQKSSSVKTLSSSITLTSVVHAPRGPGDKLCLPSPEKADNDLTELGLTVDVENGKLSTLLESKQHE